MPCDEHVVGVFVTIHLHAAKHGCDHHGMNAVGHEVLNPLHPCEWSSITPNEADVVTATCDRAARLLTAECPSLILLLVDKLERSAAEDTGPAYLLPRWLRQSKATIGHGCKLRIHRSPPSVSVVESGRQAPPESSPWCSQPSTCRSADRRLKWRGCRQIGRDPASSRTGIASTSCCSPSDSP